MTTSGSDASVTDSSSTSLFPTSGQFTNSSSSGAPPTGYPTKEPPATTEAPGPESTTSTIYTTSVHTITSCAADVPDCPERGQVTTEIISVGVTVCPVTETETETGTATGPGQPSKPTTATTKAPQLPSGGNGVPSTISVTRVYTITSCPPSVPDCPVGSVTTETGVKTTTVKPPAGGEYPTDVPDTDNPNVETSVPVESGPGSEDSTTTLQETGTETSTATIDVTKTISQPASSAYPTIEVPSVPTTPTTTFATATTATSINSDTEEVVEVTATIVPIPVSSDVIDAPPANAGSSNTTAGYPTIVPPPQGTGSFNFPNGPSEGIVEVSAGASAGASVALMALAGFFFFAM